MVMGHLGPGFLRDFTVPHLPQKALFLLTGLWVVGEGVGIIAHVNYKAVSKLVAISFLAHLYIYIQ